MLDAKCHRWPLFYRLRALDLFAAGIALAGLLFVLFHRSIALAPGQSRVLLLAGFLSLILAGNRFAWLLSGRGKIVAARVARTLSLLLDSGRIDLREFALQSRIPFSLIRQELDRLMAGRFLLGYLDRRELVIVVDDDPLAGGACPGCGAPFSAGNRICPGCGTVVYK